MAENIQGVDLSTGKIYIPLTLASLTGPNGFGETFGIQYSTLGLPPLIRTWNQDAPTGILGLGWSLTTPSIVRLGNGSIYDTFLLNGQRLILTSLNPDPNGEGCFILTFVTGINSLLQITYYNFSETWVVVDSDGITYTYGGIHTYFISSDVNNSTALQYGVNWQNTNNQGPALWSGSSVQADPTNQCQYVRIWNLFSKTNIYGQQVNYAYNKINLNVGSSGQGMDYDMASYLVGINVVGGQSLQLSYQEKQTWEYPLSRSNYEKDGTITNAYQDRIETQYLASAQVYDDLGQLQDIITFNYGFLWDNFNLSSSNVSNLPAMNKRLLTSITLTTPDGYQVMPAHTFDYWGYGNTTLQNDNDGFQTYFGMNEFDIMTMLNGDLDGSGFAPGITLPPYKDASGNTYNQLFGHLKNIQSSEGSLTWYSYAQVSQNYSEIDLNLNFDTQWQNKLDLKNITPPVTEGITWTCPRPFWGPDGYLVIRWYSEEEGEGDTYQMCIVIYEWLGQWVSVVNKTFTVYFIDPDPSKDWQIISTGMGFLAIIISGGVTSDGSLEIFNRDPNLPGQWQSASYPYSIPVLQNYYDGDNNIIANINCEVNINNNIISVLDKMHGKLYTFGWNGQSWDTDIIPFATLFPPIPPNTSTKFYNSTSSILGNSIFVLGSLISDPGEACYSIINYNPLSVNNPWVQYAGTLSDITFLQAEQNLYLLQASASNGYLVVSALMQTTGSAYTTNEPIIISWDDNFNVSCQKLLQNGNWAFPITNLETDFLSWIGQGNFFSIGDNIYYTASNSKVSLRYIGSTDADADPLGNIGWESQQSTSNKSNDSAWGNLPLPDMAIAAEGTSNITYTFYQYDPTSQTWIEASNISTILGSITDINEIISIVCFSFQVASIVLDFLAPLGILAEEIGESLNMLTMPLSTVAGVAVGLIVDSVFTEATADAVDELFDFVAPQAEGIGQNFLMNYVIKRSMDNYTNGGLGNFILCGQQYTTPSIFYNQWNPSSTPGSYGTYQWNNINLPAPANILYLTYTPIQGLWNQGLTNSTFSVGNYCIPYSYIEITEGGADAYYYICSDQVVFLNNGQVINGTNMPMTSIPAQYIQAYNIEGNFPAINSTTGMQATAIPYQIDAYYPTQDNYGSPLLTAPWGGVLGFLGTFYKSWDGYDHYQENIDTAIEFGLFMAKDEALEGAVHDYVINKVAVSDGYQTNNTFFQFMPQLAAYDRAMNTVRYNQIRIAQGADSYTNSAIQFGWKEYYLYNGGLCYADSPYGSLPFDPASATDTFSTSNNNQTNAGQYPTLVSGQTYCIRTLISQGNGDFLNGYEVTRNQTFYYAFRKNIYDPLTGDQLSIQQVVGSVPTLTANYSSPSITTYTDITDAFSNNCATLNYSYTFYDLPVLYGPWEPTSASPGYYLSLNNVRTLETVLPLATLSYTYSLLENNTTLNATYTQSLPGLIAYGQSGAGGDSNPYYNFITYNLYNSQVQKITWQLSNTTPPTQFALPSNTWGADGWQVISSQVTTWNASNNLWYPNYSYTWQGNLDGTAQTSQLTFPWGTPPTNSADDVWVQGGSVSQISANGIVLSRTSSLGIPAFSVYDQQYLKKVAAFMNAGLLGGIAFYTGFESFENLTPWSLTEASQGTLPLNFSFQSYTGNRSLSLESVSNTVSYQLVYTPTITNYNDSRNWVLALTIFSNTEGNNVALQVSVNGGNPLISQEIALGNSWTTVYLAPISFSSTSTINSIEVGFSFATGTILVDNLSLMPATEASFTINSYDSVIDQLLSTANFNDREFNTRYLYDNLKKPLGKIRKGSQVNAVDVINLVMPYYSRFGNGDSFNSLDPNALITLSAGLGSSAGYYFDFRDNLNPWNGGVANDRLLMLASATSASYTLPENNTYGYGIQLQIQGYLENYSLPLANKSLPAGTTTIGQLALGIEYMTIDSTLMGFCTNNSTIYFYAVDFIGTGFELNSSNTPLVGYTPITSVTGQWLVANEFKGGSYTAVFGVLKDNNGNYGLYYLVDSIPCIYNSGAVPLLPPFLSLYKQIYFADESNGIYSVDIGNIANLPDTFNVELLASYSSFFDVAGSCICTAQPTASSGNNIQIAFPIAMSQGNITQAYVCMFGLVNNIQLTSQALQDNITLPVAINDEGNVFVVGTNTLYAFDSNLNLISQANLPMASNTISQPVTGSGIVAVAFSSGVLCLYTPSLEIIAQISVDSTITSVPVINGDKISVVGQNSQNNQFTVYTYNTAGLLVTAPYITTASSSLDIASYYDQIAVPVIPAASSLNLTIDHNQVAQLILGVPSASISMGSYTVSWDADTNQFSLTGPNITVDPVNVAGTQGNWLFVLVNPVLYFYADGQQIFAITVDLDALPTGNFTITAGDNAISCRDILLINDPSIQVSYRDGENKVRQVQQIAELTPPQSNT